MKKYFSFNVLSILVVYSSVALGTEETAPVESTLERDMGYF
ncbi:MAG: hypothetical protein ACNYPE_09480 [Candidatus Azotimanducaceae bacterium WSBS_2022_MAG_OTU7]